MFILWGFLSLVCDVPKDLCRYDRARVSCPSRHRLSVPRAPAHHLPMSRMASTKGSSKLSQCVESSCHSPRASTSARFCAFHDRRNLSDKTLDVGAYETGTGRTLLISKAASKKTQRPQNEKQNVLPALGASALDRFLQKRPPPSKLQQLNILKEARNDPMKNRKKLDALLERRPSMDELKRRNIVKTGTTSEFHARQESLEALLGNLLLKTASNAPNSTHQREPSSQLSAFLRNRSNPSELLQNAQATLERFVDAEQLREETPKGPMQHRDKLGALLERRPSMDALKRRNIVRTTNKIGFSERKASLEALLQNLLVQTESTKFVVSPPANARDATSQLSEFLAHRDDKADKDDDVLPSVVAAPSAPSAAPKRKHHRGLSRFNGNATPLRPTTTTAEASGRLQKLLAQRPSPEALMSQNILKTTPNEMATHVKRRQLLSDLLQKRPALNELTQLGIIEEGAPTLESIEAVPLVVKRPHLIPNEPLENDAPSGDEADYTQVVFTWGAGLHGQCGLGNTRNQPFPQLVRELLAFNVLQISVGAQHSMALTSTGQAFAWGSNAHGQLALGDLDPRKSPCSIHVSKSPLCNGNVKFVSCGLFNSALIGANGELFLCGKGSDGCLGIGDTKTDVMLPRRVVGMNDVVVESVDLGDGHCVAIADNGDLWSWGKGSQGQLGHGSFEDASAPVLHATGEFWASVSCGGDHCLALGYDGNVYSWGDNSFGQLGYGDVDRSAVPKLLTAFRRQTVSGTKSGRYHSLVLCDDGTIYSTSILKKALGRKQEAQFRRVPPARIFIDCAAGVNTTFGISRSGIVYSWEYSDNDNDDEALWASNPTKLNTLEGIRVSSMHAGFHHMAVLSKVPTRDVKGMIARAGDDAAETTPQQQTLVGRSSRGTRRLREREAARRSHVKPHRRNKTVVDIDASLRSIQQDV